MEELSRRERRKAFREQKHGGVEEKARTANLTKWLVILVLVGALGLIGWWFWREISKPLPGLQLPDLGQAHVTDISNVVYNSNPPTSGSHFPVWAKKGVYDRVISDGYLIHSLEHGYIVISYNCGGEIQNAVATESAKPLTQMKVGGAGAMSFFGPTNAPPAEVELSGEFGSDECKKLVNDLSSFVNDNPRVIIVPRPGMDARIALTAWTRLDTLDPSADSGLSATDRESVKNFIDSYHNKGPEKTTE